MIEKLLAMIGKLASGRRTITDLAPVLGNVGKLVAHNGPDVANSIARVSVVLQESVTSIFLEGRVG
jgi:hypothetical protein